MNNNEVIAKMLNEAAYLLNEAAARDERKESVKSLKNIKESELVHNFLKGKLDSKEAKKVYNNIQKELKDIQKKISEIPDETTGEKILGYFKHMAAPKFIIGYVIAEIGLHKVLKDAWISKNMKNVLEILQVIGIIKSSIRKYNTEWSKTKDGEYNFNKAYAERVFDKISKKINKTYIKYYAKDIDNLNEAVELLIETANLLDDDFDYYE